MSPKPHIAAAAEELKSKEPSGFFTQLTAQRLAFAVILSVAGVGWFARGWISEALAGKADAAQTKTLEQTVEGMYLEQQLMKSDIEHLHHDVEGLEETVEGTRQDLRAIFPSLNNSRPLPTATP